MSQPASPIGSVEFIVKFDSMQKGFVDALKEAMKDVEIDTGADPQLTSKIDEILNNLRNRLRGIWTGDRAQFLTTSRAEVKHLEKPEVFEGFASAFRSKKVIPQETGESQKQWKERSEEITKDMLENWQLLIEKAVIDEPFWNKMRKKLITWQGGLESAMANWEYLSTTLFRQIIKELSMEAKVVEAAKKHGFPVFTETTMTRTPRDLYMEKPGEELGLTSEGIKVEVEMTEQNVKNLEEANILLGGLELLKKGSVLADEDTEEIDEEIEQAKKLVKNIREAMIGSRRLIKDTIDLEDMLAERKLDPKLLEKALKIPPGKYATLDEDFIKAVEDLLPDIFIKKGTQIANVFQQIMRQKIYGKAKLKEFPLAQRAGSIRTDVQYFLTKENQEQYRKTMAELGMSEEKINEFLHTAQKLLETGQTFVMFTEVMKTLISQAKIVEALEDRPGDPSRKRVASIPDMPGTITVEISEHPTKKELKEAVEKGIENQDLKDIKNIVTKVSFDVDKLAMLLKALEEAGLLSDIYKKG